MAGEGVPAEPGKAESTTHEIQPYIAGTEALANPRPGREMVKWFGSGSIHHDRFAGLGFPTAFELSNGPMLLEACIQSLAHRFTRSERSYRPQKRPTPHRVNVFRPLCGSSFGFVPIGRDLAQCIRSWIQFQVTQFKLLDHAILALHHLSGESTGLAAELEPTMPRMREDNRLIPSLDPLRNHEVREKPEFAHRPESTSTQDASRIRGIQVHLGEETDLVGIPVRHGTHPSVQSFGFPQDPMANRVPRTLSDVNGSRHMFHINTSSISAPASVRTLIMLVSEPKSVASSTSKRAASLSEV